MDYQYTYLTAVLILLIIWLALFFWRKDIRKSMVKISIIFGFAGLLVQIAHITDWWHPLTITGTPIGIEDFIFGFGVGGIASAIYKAVFNKKIKDIAGKRKRLLKIGLFQATLFFGSFFILRLDSFYSSIIAFTLPTLIIWVKRKDLIASSLLSGLFLAIISLIFYIIPEIITPGWIANMWYFENLSGITFLKAPLEDIIWFFLAGAFIGPLYEYWKGARLINIKK